MYHRFVTLSMLVAGCFVPASARAESLPSPASFPREQLAAIVRDNLIRFMPAPLHESSAGWGHTKRVANGIQWTGDRVNLRPELQYKQKNDGTWRRLRITAEHLPRNLHCEIYNVEQPAPGRTRFDLIIAFDVKANYHQQNWKAGVKLLDATARARARIILPLHCELTTRFETNGTFLPDMIIRFRVLRANVQYDNVVLEHVAGIGGEGAKLIGDAALAMLRQFKPGLERDLLAQANAAIVQAGDTKEIRLGIGGLLK